MNIPKRWTSAAAAALLILTFAARSQADPPLLSDQRYLPGDEVIASAVDVQEFSRIAPGGPGYLVVWEEYRSVLSGFVNTAYSPLTGNGIDIYAIRLDANGNRIDAGPILVCQDGRNQTKPQVAWNESAQAWLVVWTSERPDWYFFEDIVGVRISADGQVLDATPIELRMENNSPANDYGQYPTVASDGVNWLVAWADILWQGGIGYPNLAARRVSATGQVLDASPVVLFQHNSYSFGPILPHIAWASDEYLLVWEHSGYYEVLGRRFTGNLQPIDLGPFLITASGYGPRVASNGADFLVTTRFNRAHRVTHAGTSLDPGGIVLTSPGGWDWRGPDVSWNGASWCVVNSGSQAGHASIWLSRISTGGTILGMTAVQNSGHDQYNPAIASTGGGNAQVTWGERHINLNYLENIRGSRVDAGGIGSPVQEVSAGVTRQSHVRVARNGDEVLAVYVSGGGGTSRILAQRLSGGGTPIDPEPVVVASAVETSRSFPSVAWNGTYSLVAWGVGGSIYGRRLDGNGDLVDPSPVLLLTDSASAPAVGALGSVFLLAYTYTFSGDQNYLKGVRVDGGTLALIGAPAQIGSGFVIPNVLVESFGGRWFVVYEDQGNHDVAASLITGVFIDPGGVPAQTISISTSFDDDQPGLAIAGDRALVTWANRNDYADSAVEGRLIGADGAFITSPFLIANAAGEQLFTAAGWDGAQFVACWTDYRDVAAIEQLRGNIWASRIDATGTVLDPGGFQVTDDPLPEDLSQVSGGGGKAVLVYSRMSGPAGPEVQRIGYRVLGFDPTSAPLDLAGGPWRIGPSPFTDRIEVLYARAGDPAAERRIEVVSPDGRRVFHAPLLAAASRFTWDGRSDSGVPVAAGSYIFRISEGGQTVWSRRVTRIR